MFSLDWGRFKPSSGLRGAGSGLLYPKCRSRGHDHLRQLHEKTEDIPKTGAIIGLTVIIAAALAGLMIFPIIFTYGFERSQGPGLVFKTLPLLFGKLPGALFISTLFFTLFVFAALTSAIALLEVIVANFMDLQGRSRLKRS